VTGRPSRDLVVLLPARNAEADLPGYFDSVSRFADAVVALDDGSTDGTADLLASQPLVRIRLANPRRESYAGWDDAANRNRLLGAAEALAPRWILSLDADERITADDAEAMLEFLDSGALPGVAYGLQCHRMIEDLTAFDPVRLPVYRLFGHRSGQRFPSRRLHLAPVPTDIPRGRWFDTTFRIQHLGGLDRERREARYAKYREADPHTHFQASYRNLLREPARLETWQSRVPGTPVLREPERHRALGESAGTGRPAALDPERVALSVIVISQNDRDRIAAPMDALVAQEIDQSAEFILVNSGTDGTAEFVRENYPQVRVIHLEQPALPGKARNAGLAVARGDYVTFPGSHVLLPPGALQRRLDAHALGYALVTGSARNGTRTLSGWASYFLDHSHALPGRPSVELRKAPASCSYLREPLAALRGFPEERRTGEDTAVNNALFALGYAAWRSREIEFVHRSRCTHPLLLWRHHFERGRGLGKLIHEAALVPRGRYLRWLLTRYLVKRSALVTRNALRWGGRDRLFFLLSLPLMLTGILAASLGAVSYLLRPPAGAAAPQEVRA
jgi:glycosyltransferase involved in cell wall biosynthesis